MCLLIVLPFAFFSSSLIYFTHLCNLHWFLLQFQQQVLLTQFLSIFQKKTWLEARCILLDTVWHLWWWVEYESLKDIITKHNGYLFNSLYLGSRETPWSTPVPLEAPALLLAVIPQGWCFKFFCILSQRSSFLWLTGALAFLQVSSGYLSKSWTDQWVPSLFRYESDNTTSLLGCASDRTISSLPCVSDITTSVMCRASVTNNLINMLRLRYSSVLIVRAASEILHWLGNVEGFIWY